MAVKSLKNSTLAVKGAADNSVNAGYSFQDFHHLETVQLGGSAASVVFDVSSYLGTYTHFQIRMVSTLSGNYDRLMSMNGTAITRRHYLMGFGGSVTSGTDLGAYIDVGGAGAELYSHIIDILDASSSSKNKTIKNIAGVNGTANRISFNSGLWLSTSPVTSITFSLTGGNYQAGSRFSLYGIR